MKKDKIKKISQLFFSVVFLLGFIALALPATAQLPPPTDDVKDVFPAQKHYSPYAGVAFRPRCLGRHPSAHRQFDGRRRIRREAHA